MAEYIEREVVLQKVKKLQETDPAVIGKKQFADGFFAGLDELEVILRGISAAEAVEVVHGRWIEEQAAVPSCEDDVDVFWVCSVCDCCSSGESNYCPNCGAKMDGKECSK